MPPPCIGHSRSPDLATSPQIPDSIPTCCSPLFHSRATRSRKFSTQPLLPPSPHQSRLTSDTQPCRCQTHHLRQLRSSPRVSTRRPPRSPPTFCPYSHLGSRGARHLVARPRRLDRATPDADPRHKLFFDELLSFAPSIPRSTPPRSDDQLAALLRAIFNATSLDYLKQLSLVYYLLLDLDARSQSAWSRTKAQQTAFRNVRRTAPVHRRHERLLAARQRRVRSRHTFPRHRRLHPQDRAHALFVAPDADARTEVARAKLLLRFLRTRASPPRPRLAPSLFCRRWRCASRRSAWSVVPAAPL